MRVIVNLLPEQAHASDPASSVWVKAHAGTGKTRILTDRVLRLLIAGVKPSRILCLTYTNAVAAEMRTRIMEELASWQHYADHELNHLLRNYALPESLENRVKLQQMFYEVSEASQGLRIETIHSFCQYILKQFPLEAGVPAQFKILDETASLLLQEEVMHKLLVHDEPKIRTAITVLAQFLDIDTVKAALQKIYQERHRLGDVDITQPVQLEALHDLIYRALNVSSSTDVKALTETFFSYDIPLAIIAQVEILQAHSEKEYHKIAALCDWHTKPDQRQNFLNEYAQIFLTKENAPRKKILAKECSETFFELDAWLYKEQTRLNSAG